MHCVILGSLTRVKLVSNSILIVSGVYFALGVMYLRYWFDQRSRRDYLAFSLACLSAWIFAYLERGTKTSTTGADYLWNAYWSFYPATVALISIAWFGYRYLDGRKWLFAIYAGLRVIALIVHVAMPNGVNLLQVNDVGYSTFWGESLSYPIAVPNPWMILPQASHIFLLVLFLEAAFRCWRRGEVWKASTFGAGVTFYASTILVFVATVAWGLEPIPLAVSFAVLFLIGPMFYDLNYDMHRAAMLTNELAEKDSRLSESLDQLQLAASAANVGMYTRKVGGEIVWISEKAAEILGFPVGKQVTCQDYLQHVHPEDRPKLENLIREMEGGQTEFTHEYRILKKDGEVRWLYSRGRVERLGCDLYVRGALVDITKLKTAEQAIRILNGKLVAAQERERARLACELHDGLNQNMALLAIELATLRNQPKDIAHVKDRLDHFTSAVERLSQSVHRISQELHPVVLTQLGLEAALRSFCLEFSAKHEMKIDFRSGRLPSDLSDEISLCLYRIAQEALQNIVKHSRATRVKVALDAMDGEIRLLTIDNGEGFNVEEAKARSGFGLMSMYERAKHLGGRVEINSNIGEGSTIDLRIPVRYGPSA